MNPDYAATRQIQIDGKLSVGTVPLSSVEVETLTELCERMEIDDCVTITPESLTIRYHGEAISGRTPNNFAFPEKVAYVSQEAEAAGIELMGQIVSTGRLGTQHINVGNGDVFVHTTNYLMSSLSQQGAKVEVSARTTASLG